MLRTLVELVAVVLLVPFMTWAIWSLGKAIARRVERLLPNGKAKKALTSRVGSNHYDSPDQ